jgi:hypothetical protein
VSGVVSRWKTPGDQRSEGSQPLATEASSLSPNFGYRTRNNRQFLFNLIAYFNDNSSLYKTISSQFSEFSQKKTSRLS